MTWEYDITDRMKTTADRIAAKPTSIVVTRDGAQRPAQVVRLDLQSASASVQRGPNAETGVLRVLITGYKGYPELADTDLQRGDRFYTGGVLYEVVAVDTTKTWRLEALAEARR